MALIRWGDEDDKKDELLGATPIKRIASVQSSSWQPAPSGANAPAIQEDDDQGGVFGQRPPTQAKVQPNYLVSDQKAAVDERQRQEDAQIEVARAQAAAQAAERSRAFQEGKVQTQQGQPLNLEEIQADEGWRKYYDEEFNREKDSLDFWGRLMDGGGASRRAEVMARNKYNSELMNRAYDDQGNTLDSDAAMQARKLAAYNSALAEDNSTRGRAAGEAIGAFDRGDSGFWGRVNDAVNAMRQMSVVDTAIGVDDKHNTGADDVFRFGGNVIQGVATALPIGGKAVYESARGEGTDYSTGLQKELDGGERGGRLGSGAIDIAGTFFGGSGKLVQSLGAKVATKTATQAEKQLLKRLTTEFIVPSLVEGGEAGAQAAAEYFGNNGTLLDENGEIDADKVAELLSQTGESALVGTLAGGVFTGTAAGVNRFRNRGGGANAGAIPEALPDAEYTPVNGTNIEFAPRANENITPIERILPREGSVADVAYIPDRVPRITSDNIAVDGVDYSPVGRANPEVSPPIGDASVDVPQRALEPTTAPTVDTPVNLEGALPARIADGAAQASTVVPVRDGDVPVVRSEEVRDLQESRAGKSQAEEAVINQRLQEAETNTPRVEENLPEEMMSDPAEVFSTDKEFAERFMASNEATPENAKSLLARAVGLEKDIDSDFGQILKDGGVEGKTADKIAGIYKSMENIAGNNVTIQKAAQKRFTNGQGVDEGAARVRNAETREMGKLYQQLESEIRKIQRKGNLGERAAQTFENIANGRLANMLASVGLIERNLAQEIGANVISTVKNPVAMARSTFKNGNLLKSAAKSSVDGWKTRPKTVSEAYSYLIGNTYKTAMTPVEAAAMSRSGAFRTEMTQWASKQLLDKDLSKAEAETLSRTASNMTESVVNMFRGVENGMVRLPTAMEALDKWKTFMKTGEKADFNKLKSVIEKQDTVADKLIRGFEFGGDSVPGRILRSTINSVFPYVRTAFNLTETGVRKTLNPFSKSLIDDIRADQRGGVKNAANIVKNKLIDYGMLAGALALMNDNLIGYNDGDEVDKPRGIWIKVGDNEYVPVRSTPIEFPLAVVTLASELARDTASGDVRDLDYYSGIITNSIPYVSQMEYYTDAFDELAGQGASGQSNTYPAKSLAVNTAKSYVPFSNNSVQPYIDRAQGNSTEAKKTYDDDITQWFFNTLKDSYNVNRDSLDTSRDMAGRARTKDNQGTFINKTINDPSTAEFNDRITDLVEYGRQNELGQRTQDMFNTYDTGKNNNFKSVQDSITFLDVEDGGKPENEDKLEKNEKLTDLAQQIRNGYFGDTGNELLTLDGTNLKSDVSVPNKAGTKNSKLPLNMASIRNAVAQTDLGEEGNDALFALSKQNTQLYNRLKNKEISYDQYSAAKSKLNQQEATILGASPNFQRLNALMTKLDESGFFEADGLGSTRSGQTYLWNSLNALLASKGATPAAQYPDDESSFTPWGQGNGQRASNKFGDRGNTGIRWSPVQARQMANVAQGQYTPVDIKVKLGNEVKRDRTQNYSDRSF